MATDKLVPNGDDAGWPTGGAGNIDETIASADGATYETSVDDDVTFIDLTATVIQDSDTVTSVTVLIRAKDTGSGGKNSLAVDLEVNSTLLGEVTSNNLVNTYQTYTLTNAAWDLDHSAADLNGMRLRIRANQVGMGTAADWQIDAIDVDVEYTAGPLTVNPTDGFIAFTGFAPTVTTTANKTASPTDGFIAFTGFAPTASVPANNEAFPTDGTIVFTGFAPTVTVQVNQEAFPTDGAIAFTGFAPTATTTANQVVEPADVLVSFTGFAPTATATTNKFAEPADVLVSFAGFAPTTSVTTNRFTEPSFGTVSFTGFAPTVVSGQSASPSKGTVVFTGVAPTATTTANQTISPSFVTVNFTGFAPKLDISVSPSKGTVVFTGFNVTVTVSTSSVVTPSNGAIAFTGFAPTVTGGSAAVAAAAAVIGGAGNSHRRRRRRLYKLPDGRFALADKAELERLVNFYEEEPAVFTPKSRKKRKRAKLRAIPAPSIIAELESRYSEEEDLIYVLKEVAKFIS